MYAFANTFFSVKFISLSHSVYTTSLQLSFPISLSYVRPGTRFDLTYSQFGGTRRRREYVSVYTVDSFLYKQ